MIISNFMVSGGNKKYRKMLQVSFIIWNYTWNAFKIYNCWKLFRNNEKDIHQGFIEHSEKIV